MKELTVQHQDSVIASAKRLLDQVVDYPDYLKYMANWIALNYEAGKVAIMDAEAIYVFLVTNYFTYERAFWSDSAEIYALQLRANEMAASLVGEKGPDVKANDPNGIQRSIYEITKPYIAVYLFNPTCEHCQVETPKLLELYHKRRKDLEVFAIGIDTDAQEWRDYINQKNLDWINVYDPTNKSIYGKYFVNKTPELYLLNRERKIIAKNLKVFQVEEAIRLDPAGR